jgi:hypothetical protein
MTPVDIQLQSLPVSSRKLFELIANQIRNGPLHPKPAGVATPLEILEACGLGVDEFYGLLDSLKEAGLVRVSAAYPFEEIRLSPAAEEYLGGA